MDLDFLLTRDADFAVLGVRLSGVEVVPAPPGPPVAVASAAGAFVVLVLPPQHVAEQVVSDAVPPGFIAAAELSGTSRLAFDLAPGATVPLTAAGILAACTRLRPGGTGAADTRIELPWRLAFGPAGAGVVHASEPGTAASGLWTMRLAGVGTAPIDLAPLDALLAGGSGPPFATSLRQEDRVVIASLVARATALELSSLGGTLEATAATEGFRWAHRARLGRDQAVRTDQRVRLYPFGFRAVLTTITERDPTATTAGIPAVAPGEAAALRRVITLRIDDPVVATPDGSAFGRTFPFDRIALASAAFGGLGDPATEYVAKRPLPDTIPLKQSQDALRTDQYEQALIWGPYANQPRSVDDLVRAGNQNAANYQNATAELAGIGVELAAIAESDGNRNRLLDDAARYDAEADELEDPFGPEPDAETAARIRELRDAAAQATADAAGYAVDQTYREGVNRRNAEQTAIQTGAWQAIEQLVGAPRDIHDVVNLIAEAPEASAAASKWLEDEAEIVRLQGQIDAIEATQPDVTITQWPMAADGGRLMFPVRLSRGDEHIDVSMPLLMVRDLVLPEVPELGIPRYATIEDPGLPTALERSWAGPLPGDVDRTTLRVASLATPASLVPASGALWDMVGSATPRPSDRQVVQSLNIVAASLDAADMFRPTLGRLAEQGAERVSAVVGLPALQQLAGTATTAAGAAAAASSAAVGYARQFVEAGEATDVLFTAAEGLGLDLSNAADRSGGLAAMQLASDAISRLNGPVQLEGLIGGDPRKMIGDAATLLGFRIQDLLALVPDVPPPDVELPKPPAIVSELADGAAPVVRMEWQAQLRDLLAFRTLPGGTPLNLSVVSRPDGVTTDCTIGGFRLQFPFEDDEALIRLSFSSAAYRQVTALAAGAQVSAGPPKITLDGFALEFLGALKLLEGLRSAVDLFGKGLEVTPIPKGVRAALSLPVPDVGCGVFALSNVTFVSAVDVPFTADPVVVSIGFASRDKPFSLAVMAFAGGGYVEIRIDADGPQIEASLEFGARLAVNFVVAKGEVYALGGVRYLQKGSRVEISGYLRLGGSLEVLALVSVSVELRIALTYDSDGNRLVGRATLVLELDLTLWSDSVEIDSGEWVLMGGAAPVSGTARPAPQLFSGITDDGTVQTVDEAFAGLDGGVAPEELAAWRDYRAAFTGVTA